MYDHGVAAEVMILPGICLSCVFTQTGVSSDNGGNGRKFMATIIILLLWLKLHVFLLECFKVWPIGD